MSAEEMLDRLLYDEPAPFCAIPDCTIPPDDDYCEVHA